MPPEPAAGSPQCVSKIAFLQHDGKNGCRHDLTRVQFADYLVGEGKGPDGVLPLMFTARDLDPPKAFRDAWLTRDKTLDSEQIGFDGKRWPLQQAWCVEIMRAPLPEENRHYRLTVSPAARWGHVVDMQEFAQRLMERVESDLDRRLNWVASAHHNTDHPHIHVGIRGVDQKHEPVFFPKPYWEDGIRRRGRGVLAELLAERKGERRAG